MGNTNLSEELLQHPLDLCSDVLAVSVHKKQGEHRKTQFDDVAPDAAEIALQLINQRADCRRIAPDAHRADKRIDRRLGRGVDTVAETFAPAGDTFVSVDAHQQRVHRRASYATHLRQHVTVDQHRHANNQRFHCGNFHRLVPRLQNATAKISSLQRQAELNAAVVYDFGRIDCARLRAQRVIAHVTLVKQVADAHSTQKQCIGNE